MRPCGLNMHGHTSGISGPLPHCARLGFVPSAVSTSWSFDALRVVGRVRVLHLKAVSGRDGGVPLRIEKFCATATVERCLRVPDARTAQIGIHAAPRSERASQNHASRSKSYGVRAGANGAGAREELHAAAANAAMTTIEWLLLRPRRRCATTASVVRAARASSESAPQTPRVTETKWR